MKQIIFSVYNDIEKWFHLIHKLEWNVFFCSSEAKQEKLSLG